MQDFCHVLYGWLSIYIIAVFQMFYGSAGTIILASNLTLWWALFCFPSSSEGRHLSFETIFKSFICVYHSSGLWMMGHFVTWSCMLCTKTPVPEFLLVSCGFLVSTPLHTTEEVSFSFSSCFFLNPKHLILLLFLLVQTQSNKCSFLCWKTDINKSLQTPVPSDFCPEKQVEHKVYFLW